ncbi:hypothetical protein CHINAEXTREME_14970 [Halobiforma lacisalsi AJ5]|uniref:Uncharacterized protein n=1 Tax=Natronobacterium lacisalsi AJ5 TaxID=358396 RepID=M0L9A0_NATLA|nr:DUF6517 family protein [Halobiforma lacisalsi]APW98996.1 hypothetical protein CHINAEXTREME_14970 [Halobiforma lacisalsi AJ5]EMA30182.1 hypothetical protein C445_16604 [Halobiforma lacisalsi AJ5]
MHRRQFVAALTSGGVVASTGCLGDLLEDVTTVSASPAIVPESVATEVGYDYRGTEESVRTESVAGETVEVTNYASEYVRTIDLPLDPFGGDGDESDGDEDENTDGVEAGVFGLLTTPEVSVAGENFNPVGDMSRAEIAERVQDRYGELEVGDDPVDRRSVTVLDDTTTVETFEGEATLREISVDAVVEVARPDRGGDHLVIVGVYPDETGFDRGAEAERIDTLIEAIEHGDGVEVNLEGD